MEHSEKDKLQLSKDNNNPPSSQQNEKRSDEKPIKTKPSHIKPVSISKAALDVKEAKTDDIESSKGAENIISDHIPSGEHGNDTLKRAKALFQKTGKTPAASQSITPIIPPSTPVLASFTRPKESEEPVNDKPEIKADDAKKEGPKKMPSSAVTIEQIVSKSGSPSKPGLADFAALKRTADQLSLPPEDDQEKNEMSETPHGIGDKSEAVDNVEENAEEGKGDIEELKHEDTGEKSYKHLTFTKPGEKTEGQRRIEEFVKSIDEFIVGHKHFKTGKLDNYGHAVGIQECPEGRVPHVHQTHYYDKHDRVLKIELYEKEFSKPKTRIYFYEGDNDKISEAVWLDRYGKIDNVHRYAYNPETGLMMERAEYDREGRLFYSIKTTFDTNFDPPRDTEEAWYDRANNLIKRYQYKYDDKGKIIVEEHYNSNNLFEGANHFTYDERGILKEKKWQNSKGSFMSAFKYTVDDNENTTRAELYNAKNELEMVQEFKYDDVGNVVEEKWLDREGSVYKLLKY